MKEIWRDVFDFEGLYQVSNYGRVKSLARFVNHWRGKRFVKERILKPIDDGNGYFIVRLCKNNKGHNKFIHQLVAIAFIENPENKSQVNHVWGDKKDNRVSSLEWSTSVENNEHAYRTGLINNTGENNGQAKLTESQVKKIKELRGILTQKEIAKTFNLSQGHISNIQNNKKW
jgi:hypothetical protein